ncbi:MAG TPA: putative metal-binding motif-containing protein [bacterium]|nr:putative metal-binding motif-containing protein [bacterium]
MIKHTIFFAILLSLLFFAACEENKPAECTVPEDCGDGFDCVEGTCVVIEDDSDTTTDTATDKETGLPEKEASPETDIIPDAPDTGDLDIVPVDDGPTEPDDDIVPADGDEPASDMDGSDATITESDISSDTDEGATDDAVTPTDDGAALPDDDPVTVDDAAIAVDDAVITDQGTGDDTVIVDEDTALPDATDTLIPDEDAVVVCEDAHACTEEMVIGGQCHHLPRHDQCGLAQLCSPEEGCIDPDGWICASCVNGPQECKYGSDICAPILGSPVCLTACMTDEECAPGFTCGEVFDEFDNSLGFGCLPDNNICCINFDGDAAGIGAECQIHDCDESNAEVYPGATEICNGVDDNCSGVADENIQSKAPYCEKQQGVCFGSKKTCGGVGGWSPCTDAYYAGFDGRYEAVEATCDAADNDCNGEIDEPFEAVLYKTCTSGLGTCKESGFTVCNDDGDGVKCNAVQGTPVIPEKCDNLDDDCDGVVDNGFPLKNTACVVGVGICQRTGVNICKTDGSGTQCTVSPGTPAASETCNGLDDNCVNGIDEGLTGALCSNQVGVCSGTRKSCGGTAGWIANCGPTEYANQANGTYEQTETKCDGLDNDCDGSVDENVASYAELCPLQSGVCKDSRKICGGISGWQNCTDASYGVNYQTTENKCDYLDNDCDGQVDDGYLNGGKYDQPTACGNCSTDCTAIYAKPHGFGSCNATGTPICQLSCNGGFFNLNGIPDDGCEFELLSTVIYVSTADAQAIDDATCGLGPVGTGAGNHPCKTISYGLTRAYNATRSQVRVADGTYSETVTLRNGISLYGGYKADTWERNEDIQGHVLSTLTVVRGNEAGTHKRTIIANAITSTTVVKGFLIYGQEATAAGGNSYAIYISGGATALTISDNIIYGAAGGPGANGVNVTTPGAAGGNGTAGPNAYQTSSYNCTASRQNANRGTNATCSNANGGNGGGNQCQPHNLTRDSGIIGFNGEGVNGGAGGIEGYDAQFVSSSVCNDYDQPEPMEGANGADGGSGAEGAAGVGGLLVKGSISAAHWLGAAGTAGGAGVSGGGGGGGGAGGGGADNNKNNDVLGGHGGGGGAGGCGAAGATAGTAGGGSFGIFIIGPGMPTLMDNTIMSGTGGTGGKGGNGGVGGAGGHGASGGSNVFCGAAGGKGGEGGRGGHGGGGGGGAGGVAYGIAYSGGVPTMSGNTFVGGSGGSGGAGGASLGNPGGAGVAGDSGDIGVF